MTHGTFTITRRNHQVEATFRSDYSDLRSAPRTFATVADALFWNEANLGYRVSDPSRIA